MISNNADEKKDILAKYQKINGYISIFFELLIIFFSFLINLPVIIAISFPIFIILTILEQRAKICPKEYSRYIYLINLIGILSYFCFWLIPSLIPMVFFTFPLIVFLFSLYFSLQLFTHNEYFRKENLLICQHFLAVGMFIAIIYSFFDIINTSYLIFSTDPLIVAFSTVLLHVLINFIILLVSLYYLYGRYFRNNPWRNFTRSILVNTILIEAILYILVNLRNFYTFDSQIFWNYAILSLLIFPLLFLVSIFLNFLFGIFNKADSIVYCYYTCWIILIISAFFISFSFIDNYIVLLLDFLYISIFIQVLSKFGTKIDKITEKQFGKIKNYISASIFIELVILFFIIIFTFLGAFVPDLLIRMISSAYLSFLGITLINLIIYKTGVFSRALGIRLFEFFLLFTSLIIFYYAYLFTMNTLYVYIIPALLASLSFNLLIIRIKKHGYSKGVVNNFTRVNILITSLGLLLIPLISFLELKLQTSLPTSLNLINFTLYILFGILSLLHSFSSNLNLREERVRLLSKALIMIGFIFTITTVFFYPFSLLIDTNVNVILPLLLSSSYLYLPTSIALNKGLFNANLLKKVNRYNSYLIFIEISILLFLTFYSILGFLELTYNVILSLYLTSIAINLLNSILYKHDLIPQVFKLIVVEFGLIFTSFLIFLFFYQITIGTYYILNIPLLFSSISFFIPLIYLKKKKRYLSAIKWLIKFTSFILLSSILLFPTIINLEWVIAGYSFNIINTINLTLYILYGILAILYTLSRRLSFRENKKVIILKVQVVIEIIIAGTTVFYYSYNALSYTFLGIILPLLFTSLFLFLPFIFSYKRGFFNEKVLRNVILINSIFFWSCIVMIPIFTGFQLYGIGLFLTGLSSNLILVVLSSAILFFIAMKYFDSLSSYLKLREILIIHLKISEILVWLFICALSSYGFYTLFSFVNLEWQFILILSSSFLIFFVIDLVTLLLLESLKQAVFESETTKFDYYKIYKIYEFNKNLIIFGVSFSLAFLFTTFIQLIDIPQLLSVGSIQYFDLLINSSFSIFFLLCIIKIFDKVLKIEYERFKEYFEIISWLILKSLVLVIFAIYPFPIFLLNRVLLIVLIFSILSPITLYYFKNKFLIFPETQLLIKKNIGVLYYISIIAIFLELLFAYSGTLSLFMVNGEFLNFYILSKVLLFTYFYFSRFNETFEKDQGFRIYRLMFYSILFMGLFSIFLPLLSLIGIIIILYKRPRNYTLRFFCYILVGTILYIEILNLSNINIFDLNLIQQLSYLLVSFSSTLFLSILLNLGRINNLEKFTIYALISMLSFLLLYTIVPTLYNLTISLLLILSFLGIFYYRKNDKKYKWFIKPCILLAVFDFISFLSYAVFFINAPFNQFYEILTLTLTIFVSGIVYVVLFNDSPELFRKRSFLIVLTTNIISFPIFIYFVLIAAFSLPIFDLVIFTIALNSAIALFYISIAIFQWKVSWAIWNIGYRIWILLPIINYFLISQAFTGVDLFTNALNVFGYDIYGSNIIGFVICLLLSLPFWYTWIKKHFNNVLFIIWGFSLTLIYWFSQNAFFNSIFLSTLSFIGISLILLLPILMRMRVWTLSSLLWIIFSVIMLIFIYSFLNVFGFLIQINISIDLIAGGILFIILSFFPNLRSQKNVILFFSYLISVIGIYMIVFNITYLITVQFWISAFISLILMSFSLYSSRLLRLNKILINQLITGMLIVGFTGLTYFTFILIPGIELLSFSLALTVCGASFFIFNYYRLFIPAKRVIPLTIFSIGLSLSVTNLWYLLFPTLLYLLFAIFIAINLIFINFTLENKKYILWYLSPIPITLSVMEFLYFVPIFSQIFQSIFLLIFISLLCYTITFQTLLNCSSQTTKTRMQIKLLNFVCFILISTYLSIIITIISPIAIVYQTLEFSISWSILILLSNGYANKSNLTVELRNFDKNIKKFINIVSVLLYFEIFFLILGLLSDYTSLLPLESILISLGTFFILTILDLSILKRINAKFCYPINYMCYILISILLFIYLFQFVEIGFEFLFLNIIILLSQQYYSIFAIYKHLTVLNRFELISLQNRRKAVLSLLTNIIFIIIGIYISSFLTRILGEFNPVFVGTPSYFFFGLVLTLFMFVLNNFLKYKSKYAILLIFFILFQLSFTGFYLTLIFVFSSLNIFSLFMLLLINTFMGFYIAYAIAKVFRDHISKEGLYRINSLLTTISYLELSILFYGLANLYLGIIESFIISQITLFSISIIELGLVRRIRKKYILLLHVLSYFSVSVSLLFLLLSFSSGNLSLLTMSIVIFCIMQFYTNISYCNMRVEFNVEKKEVFLNWKSRRKNLIGAGFYLTIVIYLWQILYLAGYDLYLIIFLISILTHFLAIVDRLILKFIGRYSVHLMTFSWICLLTFSLLYYSSWFTTFSIYIIPVIMLFMIIELAYGYFLKLTDIWNFLKEHRERLRNFLIISSYFTLTTWPLYYLNLFPSTFWGLLLAAITIGLLLTLVDSSIGAFNDRFRKKVGKLLFTFFAFLLSIESYFLLDTFTANDFLFNISVSLLVFAFFIGFIVKPFKKHRFISFLYWALIFFLLSSIAYNAYYSGISWSILILGLMIYPFIFMLEELKAFFDKLIENLSAILKKISASISKFFTGIYNFLKRNYKTVRLLFCILVGFGMGVLFSDFGLKILSTPYSIILGLSIFGLFYGILPSKKSEDYDEVFKERMIRFITLWIGVTAFIFLFVLPYIQSTLFSIFLLLLSILGLGAIILIYLYRLEEKQRISIKWRFWTLILFFIILAVEIGIGLFLYLFQEAV